MSAYYAAPGDAPSAGTEQEQLAPVLVAFGGPAAQSRLTVAFRVFLAVPHFIVLWALAIAADVLTVIGWFAALFTGRLPVFAADFLTGFLRWQTRVFGYTILLTDEYPPFTLEDADYPIRIAVRPGRLNRLAVLFRFFLLIPAWIVLAVVAYGALTVVQFVSWLIVLISGEMPDTLYQALAAVLRYQTRVYGFACMLTSTYPGGLYGDLVSRPAADGYGPAAEGTTTTTWLLGLSAAAKRLMTGFIVLGVLLIIAQSTLQAVAASNVVTAAEARQQLQTDATPAGDAINNYPTNARACGNSLSCATSLDRRVAATLNTFADQVRGMAMPSGHASAEASALAASVSHVAGIFASLGAATSVTRYLAIANSSGLEQAVTQMNQDYINLGKTLSGSLPAAAPDSWHL